MHLPVNHGLSRRQVILWTCLIPCWPRKTAWAGKMWRAAAHRRQSKWGPKSQTPQAFQPLWASTGSRPVVGLAGFCLIVPGRLCRGHLGLVEFWNTAIAVDSRGASAPACLLPVCLQASLGRPAGSGCRGSAGVPETRCSFRVGKNLLGKGMPAHAGPAWESRAQRSPAGQSTGHRAGRTEWLTLSLFLPLSFTLTVRASENRAPGTPLFCFRLLVVNYLWEHSWYCDNIFCSVVYIPGPWL